LSLLLGLVSADLHDEIKGELHAAVVDDDHVKGLLVDLQSLIDAVVEESNGNDLRAFKSVRHVNIAQVVTELQV